MIATRRFLFLLLCIHVGSAVAAPTITVSPPIQVGTLSSTVLNEVSGVASSRSIDDVLWVHNDSGDSARFFAVSTAGALLGTFPLAGATATDWEDIAIGPDSSGGNYLYLGDIGDNNAVRSQIAIYRVSEPQSSAGGTIASGQYTRLALQYPAGARNAESLMVDPWTDDLYIVTKAPVPEVYRAPASAFDTPGQVAGLTALGTLSVSLPVPSAADISPNGRHILIRNDLGTAYLFSRSSDQSVWDAVQGSGIPITLVPETNGEAIGWAADGAGFFTTSERENQGPRPIYYYAVSYPGDLDDDGRVNAQDIDLLWEIVRGAATDDPGDNDVEDFNEDGLVNQADVDYLLANLLDAGLNRSYGDADLDGAVGGLDFTAWRLRAGSGWAHGDFDGDGGIGGIDFTLWRTRPNFYPDGVGSQAASAAYRLAVPEPASLPIAILACFLLIWRAPSI